MDTEERDPCHGVRNDNPSENRDEIVAALNVANKDQRVRSIIITGGSNFFSAGADLTEVIKIRTASDGVDYFKKWQQLNNTLEEASKPVIAAIEGFCLTGGCELALACDIRVAGEGATFAITSSRIGTVAGAGGTQRLPRIIGLANALDLLFSAEAIDAGQAYRIGLINRIVQRGQALDTALSMAAIYAERAPLSLSFAKRAVYRGIQMDLASGIELERFITTTIYCTDDKQEGISAFLEKRKPRFCGN
jgi:enoyl-CoA hydratase/carnithine racemase